MPLLASFDDIVQSFNSVSGPALPAVLGVVGVVVALSIVAFVQARRKSDAAQGRADRT